MRNSTKSGFFNKLLGRAAAFLWRQRQRAHDAPVAPTAASLGRAAGTLVGKRVGAGAQASGAVATSLRRGGRQLWARCANVFSRLGLQVSAVIFLFFAGGFGVAGAKSWSADHAHLGMQISSSVTTMSSTTWLELGLAVLFAYFGISSWFRAAARKT